MPKDLFDDMKFFLPSVQLTKRMVHAIHEAHSADLHRVSHDQRQIESDEDDRPEIGSFDGHSSNSQEELGDETFVQQRQIASELFGFLAFQSESPQAKHGHATSIHDSVISGMSVSLGLSEQNVLLSELANEFCAWLKDQGEFTAGWGRVIYADSDCMYLEEFPVDDLDTDESTKDYAEAAIWVAS